MTEEEANETVNSCKMVTCFVESETDTDYYVLTCAHAFGDFYSAQVQINCAQINTWFQVLVICQHYEQNMANTFPNLYADPDLDPRIYTPATVSKFDQNKDIMFLRINKDNLYSDNNLIRCEMPHPSLRISRFSPPPLNDVLMVSWPPLRKDTPVIGQVISQSRVYGQITRDQSKGYDMHLTELNICGGDGSSGAPVLNNHGHVVCMYHGRLNSVGYGISREDLHQFLIN